MKKFIKKAFWFFVILAALDDCSRVQAHADIPEQWFCTEESSQQVGQRLQVCGAGDGQHESDARIDALNKAIEEFKVLCRLGTGCVDKNHGVYLKRTTCHQNRDSSWKCYRMIEVDMSDRG